MRKQSPAAGWIRRFKSRLTPSEIRSKIKIKEADAWLQRAKELVITSAVVFLVAAIACLCVWVIVHPKDFSPETQKWVETTLTAVVSASVGYAVRGKPSKAD